MQRWFRLVAALTALAAMPATETFAETEDWPNRHIKLIVPFAPGASADLIARSVADELNVSVKQPVVVENRSGGGGTIGAEFVARSAPDGYTLLVGNSSTNGIAQFVRKALAYDPINDFTPLTNAVEFPIALVVHRSVPVKTVAQFIEYAKRKPGKVSFGSSGYGTTLHLAGELLKARAGIDMVHVAYRGGAPAMNDLIAGEIPAAFAILSTALPNEEAGHIKILGTAGAKRSRVRPDIPTIAETVPDYVMPSSWVGFLAPAGLPDDLTRRLNSELRRAITVAPVRKVLEENGFEIATGSAKEFAEMIRKSLDRFGKITSEVHMAPQ